MLVIYSERITSRFKYICKLLFTSLLGLKIRFINDKEEYLHIILPKINYSKNPMEGGIFIYSANILFETDIFEQTFQYQEKDSVPIFFLTREDSRLSFDPLAASFYFLSRYEEYLPFIADEHNRFPVRESLLYKLGKLHIPVVSYYTEMLEKLLFEFYPSLEIKKRKYNFVNTIDIDNAYAYLGKGLLRTMGSYARDISSMNILQIADRSRTLIGLLDDPYDTFSCQLALQEKYNYSSLYFALFSQLGQYDRNLTMYSSRLRKYLKRINNFCEVGIHPSYRSNDSFAILEEECKMLQKILRIDITKSRQHFLKLSFPKTYRYLLDLEITDDYSMGFADETGFRAGICTPFRFYDLEMEVETPLIVHPFPFMDGTYIYYKNMRLEDTWNNISSYIKTYRKYGGEFTPIWHNRVFSEKEPEWKGWNNMFEEMVKAAI